MILGIDIGGTSVKLGIVDKDGNILFEHEAGVAFDGYKTPILATVVSEAARFVKSKDISICGIGVSATGQIDDRMGTVRATDGSIPNYTGSQIRKELENEFHVPISTLNDANAAALGECFAGRAKGLSDIIMVTIGTGVGGGIVINKKIYNGAGGVAGEIGHFVLDRNGAVCSCGSRGCFQNYASTKALVKAASVASGESNLNGRIIFERVNNGDTLMKDVLNNWICDICYGLTGLIHIFNPEMLIIGGGVSVQKELFIDPLRRCVLKSIMPSFAEDIKIESAMLGNRAGIIGAAKYFMDMHPEIEI